MSRRLSASGPADSGSPTGSPAGPPTSKQGASGPQASGSSPGRRFVGARAAPVVLFVAFVVALALLAVDAYFDYRNAQALELSSAKVSRTLEAMDKLRQTGNTLFVAESAERGFLLTGDPSYLTRYEDMRQRIPDRLSEIDLLVSDTPSQRESAGRLRGFATNAFHEFDRALDAYRRGGQTEALSAFRADGGTDAMTGVRDRIRAMLDAESRTLVLRRAEAARAYSTGVAKGIGGTVIVALALAVFYGLMHRYLRQRDEAIAGVKAINADLEQRVIDRTIDLSHLSRHLLGVREHEKKIIARDLHDDFGSYLTAINMDVSRARDKIAATNPEQAAKLERTLGLLGSAIEMKRQLISDLRPSILDNLGLGAALEQYLEEWSRRTGIESTFDHDGELVSNDEGCPIAIFRVFQEALANVAKHAKATRVAGSAYRVGDAIEFEIADDGVGISAEDRIKPGVHGLLGIRERVLAYDGEVEIIDGPRGGTVVRGRMPCMFPEDAMRPPASAMHFA